MPLVGKGLTELRRITLFGKNCSMKAEYVLPAPRLDAFNCPNCHVYCRQHWFYLQGSDKLNGFGLQYEDARFELSDCERCKFPTIWLGDKMIYPVSAGVEPPNRDLGEEIVRDYNEARAIVGQSPRGAAALLRLAIQKLCKNLGQSGKDINKDIQALVASGLPPKVQAALDSVRVIGNEAVHPGTLDLKDDRETAVKLFRLVNFIATKMITEPKEIDGIYGSLPKDKLEGIKARDAQKKTPNQ